MAPAEQPDDGATTDRPWSPPTFEVHGIRPPGGERAADAETTGSPSYDPMKSV
jgi:hypothetical protein